MATKAPLAALYAQDEQQQKLVDEITSAYSNLRSALDSRQQLFDPTLLAAAQGFLAPTKSGGFGESLGNVAAAVGPIQEQERKRSMEEAQMRLELAQSELGMRQQAGGMKMFRDLLGGAPAAPGAPVQAAPGAAAPGAAAPGAAAPGSSAQVAPGIQQDPNAPRGFSKVTPEAIAMLGSMPGMKQTAELLRDMVKLKQDRYAVSMNGIVFDKWERKYLDLDIPGQKQEDFATPYGTYKMTPNEYARFRRAESEGKGKDWIDSFIRPGGMAAGVPGAPGRKTVAQSEAEKAGQIRTTEERAKSESERYEDIIKKGAMASSQLPRLKNMYALATGPNASQYLGIFRGPKFSDAIGLLAESAVPNVREVFTNLGLDKDVKAEQLAFTQQAALVNAEMRKILRSPGEGAQSDLENRMALAAGVEMTDPARGMAKKIQFLQARAEFENEIARELNKSKMNATDFILSPDSKYQQLLQNYEQKLGKILGVTPEQAKPSSPYSSAGQKLRQSLMTP